MEKMSIFETLSLSTIRIECKLRNGAVSSGTGFFVKFVDQGGTFIPAIVTNKHVVVGAETGFLLFTLSGKDGKPNHDIHHKFEITNFHKPWLNHPDPDIDLCAIPINVFVNQMKNKGIKPFITFLDLIMKRM